MGRRRKVSTLIWKPRPTGGRRAAGKESMGAIDFSIDVRLVECLRRELPISVFVETGTFEGEAIARYRTCSTRSTASSSPTTTTLEPAIVSGVTHM